MVRPTSMIRTGMGKQRTAQLGYSELMEKMLDEDLRLTKARKILSVILHFLGRGDLSGLHVADVGCSAGFIAHELAAAGGRTTGFDIDQPGLAKATARFGDSVQFTLADGEHLPVEDRSLDVIVFNHIYEHVVDPDSVVSELHRVLRDDGVAYLGFANRLGVMEPHYRLPFLSYLPPTLADQYVRLTGRADHYHERLATRPTLRKLARGFTVWDYTFSVVRDPRRFSSDDVVRGGLSSVPSAVLKPLTPLVPTYIWMASKADKAPLGPALRTSPSRLRVRPMR